MPASLEPSRARPKRGRILDHLRGQILTGRLSPGGRLPTRETLERRFKASPVTVQHVFDHLIRDGYVQSRGRNGTFVAPHPPHLSHFGLVFMHRPAPAFPWSLFYKALTHEAQSQSGPQGEVISTYYHGMGHTDSADYRALESDVLSHRVGGLIFVFPPHEVAGTPVVTQPGVPRVCVSRGESLGMPGVGPDTWSFFRRAAEHLASLGRRRVALITPEVNPDYHQTMTDVMRRAGLELRPYWLHVVNPGSTIAARHVSHVLTRLPAEDRPDALIVADDNLLDETLAGLVASGIRVPDDLAIVSHWNFPNDPPRAVPVTYLGFDCRDMLRRCLVVIDRQRRGEKFADAVPLPAVFEQELISVSPISRPTRTSAGIVA